MKKLIYISFVFAVLLALASCEKEVITPEQFDSSVNSFTDGRDNNDHTIHNRGGEGNVGEGGGGDLNTGGGITDPDEDEDFDNDGNKGGDNGEGITDPDEDDDFQEKEKGK